MVSGLLSVGIVFSASQASADTSSAASISPTLLDQAEAERLAGRLSSAAILVEKAYAKTPYDPRVLVLWGELAAETGAFAQAETLFRRALGMDETDRTARHGLAAVLTDDDRPAEARVEFLRLLKDDETDATAWAGLGRSHLALADRTAAADAFRMAAQHDPLHQAELHRFMTVSDLTKNSQGRMDQPTFTDVGIEAQPVPTLIRAASPQPVSQ